MEYPGIIKMCNNSNQKTISLSYDKTFNENRYKRQQQVTTIKYLASDFEQTL